MNDRNAATREFKFSVIIPIYNTEQYIDDAIQSIIGQTIGFEDNIQLVLVNDGSKDNSESICLKYRDLYPDNVIYINLEKNGGVSRARNIGLEHAKGKYINFLDSDDKWNIAAFERAYDFFEEHYEEIDCVSARVCFFGRKKGFNHPLDYKYRKDEIIDINEKYDYIQLFVNSIFLKREAIKGMHFDENVMITEDGLYICQLIIEKEKYGVLKSAVYHYRKRSEQNSVIDLKMKNKLYYFLVPRKVYMKLFDISKKKYGMVIPYIQYQVMYDMQWRLKEKAYNILSEKELMEYISIVKSILSEIDVYIIEKQRNIDFLYKLYAINLKYGRNVLLESAQRKNKLFLEGTNIFSMCAKNRLIIDILQIENDTLKLEGRTELKVLEELYTMGILYDKGFHKVEYYKIPLYDKESFCGDKVFEGMGFRIELPLKRGRVFKFVLMSKAGKFTELKPYIGEFAKVNREIKYSYYAYGGYLTKFKDNKLIVADNRHLTHIKAEVLYSIELLKKKQFKAVGYRILAKLYKACIKKPIWIISDRSNAAKDNGMHLFKYIMQQEADANVYFTINKKCDDYKVMKKIGKIVPLNTFRYKILFLSSDLVISSHADDWVTDAFVGETKYCKDLYDFKFVFLQHGITKDDLTGWLHKTKKNIRIFVTAARDEYKSIVNGNYGYTEEQVKLTGFPRYDNLRVEKQEKIILFMPTWRRKLAKSVDKTTLIRPYNERFKESEYFHFYNSLINDQKLLTCMKEEGYKGISVVHPSHGSNAKDFTGNEMIGTLLGAAEYQELFNKCSLMVTDYSSVAMDFAYEKKPVIYTQFDKENFFETHLYDEGYFNYTRDGFGHICSTYDESVSEIMCTIKNGCVMEEKYRQRVDKFFKYNDTNNCSRVYQEILKL